MKRLVVGFLIDENNDVLMIQKNRPEWQAGFFNGIGGHVEDGESAKDAMTREMMEEANVKFEDWELMLTLEGTDYFLYVYVGFAHDKINLLEWKSMTDEPVSLVPYFDMDKYPVLPSAAWMIKMINDQNARNLKIKY